MTDTRKYKFNHTMLKVKNPKAGIDFYQHLGMRMVKDFQLPAYGLELYFLAYDSPGCLSAGNHLSDREGVLELSYNETGDVKEPHMQVNDDKAQIGVCVGNLYAVCKRLSEAGYLVQNQSPEESRELGFGRVVLDPDNYKVQICSLNPLSAGPTNQTISVADCTTYRLNYTMIRIKEKERSLWFYQGILGMTLRRSSLHGYLLGYGSHDDGKGSSSEADREGLLELTWDPNHQNGVSKVPFLEEKASSEFGHLCVSVDDIEAACQRFQEQGVTWHKRLMDGSFRVAFIADPNGHLVEIIQNERYKPVYHEF